MRVVPTVVPCRPTVTCTAELAAPASSTSSSAISCGGCREEQRRRHHAVSLKLPLAHWIEVQLGGNGYTIAPSAHYFDDIVAGVKLHVADQTTRAPSLAVTASVGVPTVAQLGYTDVRSLADRARQQRHPSCSPRFQCRARRVATRRPAQLPAVDRARTIAGAHAETRGRDPESARASASPVAARDASTLAAIELTARAWLVIDAALEATGWGQRSVSALAGLSITPTRLWARPMEVSRLDDRPPPVDDEDQHHIRQRPDPGARARRTIFGAAYGPEAALTLLLPLGAMEVGYVAPIIAIICAILNDRLSSRIARRSPRVSWRWLLHGREEKILAGDRPTG